MMLRSLNRRRIPPSGRRWMCTDRHRGSTVMSFGDGSHGALGLPISTMGVGSDAYEPTPIAGLPGDVTSIAAGHFHSLAVTREGHVYAWGRNAEGQLGRDPLSSRETWNEPKRIEGLEKVRVEAAAASGVVSAALGEDGSVWVWGSSKRGQLGLGKGITEAVVPSRVETLVGEHIVKVSLGWGHALAMCRSGKLFGWGYYADGRIGKMGTLESNSKEKDMATVWEPGLVEGLKVEDVACGLDHSLIVCSDGTLLSGGSNAYGQLGRRNQDLGMQPVDIGFRTLRVASGLGHSLAICEGGAKVFSWGWNESCQLGRGGPGHIPQQVEGLDGEICKSVSAGRAHSLVLTAKNDVWAWGCGRNGRLGLCSSADEAQPMLVDFSHGFKVWEAVAGLDHSLVLGEIVC